MAARAAPTSSSSRPAMPLFLLLLLLLGVLAMVSSSILDRNSNAWHARFPQRGWLWKDKEFVGMLAGEDVETKLCDPDVNSQAGYFKISGSKDKNYFYWFFESRSKPSEDPLIIWLTGGPGCSSILALLMENGPCSVNADGTDTIPNPHSWTNNANMLWVDQPAGVGFSYQDSGDSVTDTEEEVAEDLYHFLQSFLTANPEFVKNDLYVFGESYGGHFVPAVGHKIFQANKENKGLGNLKGLGIGNGLTDPELQYQFYGEYARNNSYGIDLVSAEIAEKMDAAVPRCVSLIHSCQTWGSEAPCRLARLFCNKYILEYFPIGQVNVYDIRLDCPNPPLCYDFDPVEKWLNNPSVQEALHVRKKAGNEMGQWSMCSPEVLRQFSGDMMLSYDQMLVPLLESGIKVLNYAGDADFICNYLGVEAWSDALVWKGQEAFQATTGTVWTTEDGREGGVVRSAEGFTFLRMFESGHMVPLDQPAASAEMVAAWTGVGGKGAKERWEAVVLASAQGGREGGVGAEEEEPERVAVQEVEVVAV